LVPVIFKF
jgi:hypothetical protein